MNSIRMGNRLFHFGPWTFQQLWEVMGQDVTWKQALDLPTSTDSEIMLLSDGSRSINTWKPWNHGWMYHLNLEEVDVVLINRFLAPIA